LFYRAYGARVCGGDPDGRAEAGREKSKVSFLGVRRKRNPSTSFKTWATGKKKGSSAQDPTEKR